MKMILGCQTDRVFSMELGRYLVVRCSDQLGGRVSAVYDFPWCLFIYRLWDVAVEMLILGCGDMECFSLSYLCITII